MAASPRWKIYDSEGQYQASAKDVGLAAMIVMLLGDGATIRDGHTVKSIVWTEGREDQSAGENYDHTETVIYARTGAR
jgi:hypothetical protein